ncbi:tetratricopeptide repeat protein [bacterium]|jgi:tetratricopeptide (TPR) repeat protein|nr:tetratricopeptide repeat protein [Rhodopirellula sp.]MDB4506059.1 tetratricopeptide repeat protein [bacterium]
MALLNLVRKQICSPLITFGSRWVNRTQIRDPFRIFVHVLPATLLLTVAGCQWAASGHNTTGTQLYEQGQYTAALQRFQKVISTDPQNADGYYNLAATTHRLGNQRGDQEMLTQAESLYNQCLDHDPNHLECHRGLAVLLVDTGRNDRAFALMKNWATQNPGNAEARIELARLYEEANDPSTAMKYLEDAVQKDANNPRAWLALAKLRQQSGDLPQALQNYQQSLAINPAQPMAAAEVTKLSHQISGNAQATVGTGSPTQIAAPAYGGGFMNRY